MNLCADSSTGELALFQGQDGGSIPTSAHQFIVRPISKLTANRFIERHHYLGITPFLSTYHYGAYFGDLIYGAIAFGTPNATDISGLFSKNNQDGVLEIKRLAMTDSAPKNSESRFIAISVRLLRREYPLRLLVTYADSSLHVGTIYKASGFEYVGLTATKCDFWVNGKINQRGKVSHLDGKWVPRSQKHLFLKSFSP